MQVIVIMLIMIYTICGVASLPISTTTLVNMQQTLRRRLAMQLSQCLPRCLYSNYPPLQQTLTVAGWVIAWPCAISLAGTHVVPIQCVASVTRVRNSCTHKCLVPSLWVVVQRSISDVWKETTVHNYRTNDVIIMILVGIHMYRLCLVQAPDERRSHVKLKKPCIHMWN